MLPLVHKWDGKWYNLEQYECKSLIMGSDFIIFLFNMSMFYGSQVLNVFLYCNQTFSQNYFPVSFDQVLCDYNSHVLSSRLSYNGLSVCSRKRDGHTFSILNCTYA